MRGIPPYGILIAVLSFSVLHAETSSSSQSLREILPVGSSLYDIQLPRYDKNYKLVSHMDASRIDFLEDNILKGTNVLLKIFNAGKQQAETTLNSAYYYEQQEVIHSTHNLTIFGEQFDIAAQGLTANWNKRAGFLLGKTQTLFYPEKDKKMTSSSNQSPPVSPNKTKKPVKTLKKTAATVAIVGTSIPTLLSAQELQELEDLSKPSDAITEQVDAVTLANEQNLNQEIKTLDKQRSDLSEELIAVVPADNSPEEIAEPLPLRKEDVPVSVEAENGMYFDSLTGTAIYQKDVVVIHPRMHLTCSNELKVFLKKLPQTENAEAEANTAPKFDGLDKAIAIGNVVIRAKDDQGKNIITHSDIATYDADTGVIILKGGRPTVQQGNTIARILSDSGYIKILPNMSVRMVGKHEIHAELNELQNQ